MNEMHLSQRPDPDEVRALFSPHAVRQSWLEVEASLAEVQAELGIVPKAAAAEIRAKANFSAIDETALVADIARTRAPIVSLVRFLSAACGEEAGGFVHWGATTQNVIQTGYALLMREAHGAFMQRFGDILRILADLADRHAVTLTVSRTNMRHALPVTFGFKAAGWIEEWLRHKERFEQAAPRIFCAQWGGAVGAMHALGADGPKVNRRLAERLGLGHYTIASRAALDGFAEYVSLVGLFAATCSKIARTLYGLMADEIGEVSEAADAEVVGSSTMPHKINPKLCVQVIAVSGRLRGLVPVALDAMQPSHEGDAASNMQITALIEQACPLAYELADQMAVLLQALQIDAPKMRRNLDLNGGALLSEYVMMRLAPAIGRTVAHDLVHRAVDRARDENIPLGEALSRDAALPSDLSSSLRDEGLDPGNYAGLSVSLAREMAIRARKALSS